MNNATFPAGRLSIAAFVIAVISVAAFVSYVSISSSVPKTIAYGSNPLFAIYSWAPLVSGVAGLLAVVLAVTDLRGSPWAVKVALVGLTSGILLFFFVTILVANVMSTVAPPPIEGKGFTAASFPSLILSPPAVGIGAVAIAAAVILSRLQRAVALRLAIASVVTGGVVTAFWLFNLLLFNLGGE